MAVTSPLILQPEDYSLLTDLYQLTMAACYVGEGLDQRRANFEVFVRRLPEGFGYLIAMGLEQVLDYLEQFQFSPDQLSALQATGIFEQVPDRFWDLLAHAKFDGDVWAVPEGMVMFANEPLLRIEAPLWQAQLVETYILNTINYQTLIATKAARLRDVAGPEAILLEFGTRRAFSPQASLWAARASLAAGLNATSNVLAALKLGCKPSGTMAHALVMALTAISGSEMDAFNAFHHYFPGAPLLIDTYNTIAAAQQLSALVASGKVELNGVRLDSGDLAVLSKQVRSLLPDVPIFASGDLDEYRIAELQAAGACIDGYGLGTKLVTGDPVNGVYKLVDIDGIPVMKEAEGKITYPGCKQVFRRYEQGQFRGDRLGLMAEMNTEISTETTVSLEDLSDDPIMVNHESPLLKQVLKQGKRLLEPESLATIAYRARKSVNALPSAIRQLDHPVSPTIEISAALQVLTEQTRRGTGDRLLK